jgi:DNA-binding beta-propeller fold protein YncE
MKTLSLIISGIIFQILIACSSSKNLSNLEEPVVYPLPPDKPRIQYLTSFSKSSDFSGEQSFFSSFIIGEDEPLPILKPYGLAVGNKKIYVCDSQLGGLEIMDLEDGTFGYFIPENRGRLKQPINCFVDKSGYLYVADPERGQIIIYNPDLECFAEIGDSTLIRPTDVFVTDKQIFINDVKQQSIQIYDRSSLKYVKSITSSGDGSNKLFSPTNIYVYNDKIYISDIGDSKIKVFNINGSYESTIGTIGITPGKFSRPKGIAVDKDGNVFVVDAGFENVQVFDKESNLLMYFGGSYSKPGDMWLPAKIAIDYNNLDYFKSYVDPSFDLKYLIFVTNQYGPDKISVYGFISEKNN